MVSVLLNQMAKKTSKSKGRKIFIIRFDFLYRELRDQIIELVPVPLNLILWSYFELGKGG